MSNKRMPGTAAATRICGVGVCFCGYNVCSNPNSRTNKPMPMLGHDEVCPLAKYNCQPIPRPSDKNELVDYWTKTRVTIRDCNNLCKHCEHLSTNEEGYITDECYYEHCRDCPVNKAREAIQEAEAEARCS